jgi:hypothetical protein
MMRIILILTALLLGAAGARAQSLESFKARLSHGDSLSSARVQVVEHGSASSAVRSLAGGQRSDKVRGYRVRIFFDNSQNARGMADGTISRFREMFPDVPAYMSYENPYFKVMVGNCATMEEAIILKGRIEGAFDRAFIAREDIPLSKLAE